VTREFRNVGIGAAQAQSRVVARTKKQTSDDTKKAKSKPGVFASEHRIKRADVRNTYTDEELRHWFADDPTTELRTHLRRTMQTLIAMGIIKPGEPMPGYRRLAEVTGQPVPHPTHLSRTANARHHSRRTQSSLFRKRPSAGTARARDGNSGPRNPSVKIYRYRRS
jgi:hypothetical protein